MGSFHGSTERSEEEQPFQHEDTVALSRTEIWKKELKALGALSVPVGISQLSRVSMSVTDTLFLVSSNTLYLFLF
jgi:Na+-driven multidrug efflux pump